MSGHASKPLRVENPGLVSTRAPEMRLAAIDSPPSVEPKSGSMSSSAVPSPRQFHDWFRPPVVWVSVPLLAFTVGFICLVWPEWTRNPDLSHGLFAPVVFALLLWEGSRQGTRRWLRHTPALSLGSIVLVLAALAAFGMAGLLSATVGWSHSLVIFVLAGGLVLAWLGALLLLAGERVRLLPLNWTILTAIGLWLLAAPLPEGTYKRLTLALQHSVTTGVIDALHLLGIPARQLGNIIELANTSVGVEDACSGIRSLISCLYAGFFFAAWLVRGPGKRLLLIVTAPVLAITMNYVRSLALTLMANGNVDIGGFWHDATGYAILGLTSLILAGLANALASAPDTAASAGEPLPTSSPPPRGAFAGFAFVSLAIVALGVFFASFHYRTPAARDVNAPSVESLIPEHAPGWQVITTRDLYRFSAQLLTQQLAERTFVRDTPDGPVQITLYIAHWEPGQASVSMVASHTPDACWPGGGWASVGIEDPQVNLETGGRLLPRAEHRLFRYGRVPQHVWFWHVYNDHVINYRDPYSVRALLEIAWRYGFRREGSQYFVRLSSNQPWAKIAHEPLVQEMFARLAPIGLSP